MDKRKFKRLAKKSLDMDFRKEPTLIDITHDDEAMERVLKGVAEMQNDVLRKAEKIKKAMKNGPQQHEEDNPARHS